MKNSICGKEMCEAYFKAVEDLNAAKKLSKKLDTVLDSSYDGIFITDGEGITMWVNKAYERITGINPSMFLGKSINILVENGFISKSCTSVVLETKEISTIEQRLATGKVILVTGTPIFDQDGNIEMVVNNVRDITELLSLKEELKAKEKTVSYYNIELEKLRKQMAALPGKTSRSTKMQLVMESARRVAKHATTVLLYGETGSGKEVMASFIHKNGDRRNQKLININCSAIPENLMESEFFGYEKGSFSGASTTGKIGLFEEANGGTIFLDEIAELPLNMQSKLLRVLQEQEIQRIGGLSIIKIDVRIIAATNQDLLALSEKGLFRKDLYYRLNIFPLVVPALRERKEDIFSLANDFLAKFNQDYNQNKRFSKGVYEAFNAYDWPGNVRELKNLTERIFVMSESSILSIDDLPKEMRFKPSEGHGIDPVDFIGGKLMLKDAVARLELQMLSDAYGRHGNVRDAASELGIDPSTFVRKRARLDDSIRWSK